MGLDWSSAPTSKRGMGGWLLIPLILAGGLLAFVATSLIRRQDVRQRVWPIVRQTAARLQTDEGALELYRRNPDLQLTYPTGSEFLDRVRSYRARFAALPGQEPAPVRSPGTGSGPWGFRSVVEGDGAVMLLSVQSPGPLGFGGAKGEGIAQILFSATRESLWQEMREARRRRLGLTPRPDPRTDAPPAPPGPSRSGAPEAPGPRP